MNISQNTALEKGFSESPDYSLFDNCSVKIAAGTVLVSQGNWDCVLEENIEREADIGLYIQM